MLNVVQGNFYHLHTKNFMLLCIRKENKTEAFHIEEKVENVETATDKLKTARNEHLVIMP